MHPMIRKTLLSTETLYTDGAKAAGKPLVMIAAAAVIKTPGPVRAMWKTSARKFVNWRRCSASC